MFADDTTLHTNDNNINTLAIKVQKNVDDLVKWTEYNHMAINSNKTKAMLVANCKQRQFLPNKLPPIYIKGDQIEEVDSHVVLGVTIQNNLGWSEYLTDLTNKISNKAKQLNLIKHFLDFKTKRVFFHAYIQPVIGYVSTLWDQASNSDINPINNIYNRAIKQIILKSTKLEKQDYLNVNILPLAEKLKLNKALLMHKIINKIAPTPLVSMFNKNENRNNHNEITVPQPRIEGFKKSLQFSGGVLWNDLPPYLRKIESLSLFKSRYIQTLFQAM
jgi:hypothetical protein